MASARKKPAPPPPEAREATAILVSFLEVALHALLYARELYTPAAFEPREHFGVQTRMCRHPGVRASVSAVLADARPHIAAGSIESLIVLVFDEQGNALEQFCFDVNIAAPPVESSMFGLNAALGEALMRIAALDRTLPRLPAGCFFEILLDVHEGGERAEGPRPEHGTTSILDPDSPWTRVSSTDPEAALWSHARFAPALPSAWLGVVRAGSLELWVRMQRR